MDTLSVKTLEHFRGKVVRKDLTNLMKRGANVPTMYWSIYWECTAQQTMKVLLQLGSRR